MSLRAVSGGGSSWTPTPYLYDAPGTYSLTLTGTQIRYMFMTGTGPGGGGAGGYNAANGPGGGGGGPGVAVEMMPILINPTLGGGSLTIVITDGGAGGAAGANGSDGTETYIQGTCIISPLADGTGKISLGYGLGGKAPPSASVGGDGGGTVWSAATAALAIDTLNTGTAHAAKSLCVATGNMQFQWMHTLFQGPGGGGYSAGNGANCGSVLRTVNGKGCGPVPTGTFADATGGAGAPGGGSSASTGGMPGVKSGVSGFAQTGGNASEPGGGGGGGFSNFSGGNGGKGRILLLV